MGNNSSSMDSNTNYNTNSNYNSNSPMKRTDRNMNPTAFTTSVAKQAGLVEGVDYVQ